MADRTLAVLVLAGGPDAERAVSLRSGAAVAGALRAAGHGVTEADAGPTGGAIGMGAVDRFASEHADGVVFAAMHGPWGEGGGLQAELEARGVAYVGSGPEAAAACMDKAATKAALREAGIDTPEWAVLDAPGPSPIGGAVAVKPIDQGSSLGLSVCRDEAAVPGAIAAAFAVSGRVMVERVVDGPELTVGVVDDDGGVGRALTVIRIEPGAGTGGVYDYAAKYERDDTGYRVGAEAAGLDAATAARVVEAAERTHAAMGCRHVSRVDVMLDGAGRAWVIEVNTLPGFTDHSLLPMAAEAAGLGMAGLCDRLVWLAAGGGG